MKKFIFLIVCVFSLSFALNAQDFNYSTVGDETAPIYQAIPDDEKILSDAELGKAFQSLGIIAQPDKDNFGFVLVNVSSDEYQLDNKDLPYFIFLTSERTISSSDFKIITKKKVKKMRVEIVTIKVTRPNFERIIASKELTLSFGALKFIVPTENIEALHFVGEQVRDRYAMIESQRREAETTNATSPSTTSPTNSGGTVQVKGYYRRDGTYVRPHTRRSPSRKN